MLECPNPVDAAQGRSEGPVVEVIGRLIGHEVLAFLVRSKREFEETCNYVSSIEPEHDASAKRNHQLCLHISAHGNERGLGIGADLVRWSDLAAAIQPFMHRDSPYKGARIVVLSACRADRQKLSAAIKSLVREQKPVVPPKYLFCASGDVSWQNAAVGWTLFYHHLPDVDLDNRKAVQRVLDQIKAAGIGHFVYFRWDARQKKYLRYAVT